MELCKTCQKEYSPTCDWQQGRCPHHPALWERYKALLKRLFNWSGPR